MSKKKIFFFLGIISTNLLLNSFPVKAQTVDNSFLSTESMTEINNVSGLRDVSPTDWAYEALRNLVERYGCIVGYPARTFRGNRALSRYEFAAGLNGCLQQMERLLTESGAVLAEDIETLKRLMKEFETELATLDVRISNNISRVAFLEDHQFSTTTKLRGEVVLSLTNAFGDNKANSNQPLANQTVLDDRVRLNFDTSFTGKDLLKVRLDATNAQVFGPPLTGTQMTRLTFDLNTENQVEIGRLFYRFPVGKKLKVTVDATGGRYNANLPNYNKLFAHPFTGSISRFGRHNPIYYQGILGAGVSARYTFSNAIDFSLGYLARKGNEPEEGKGLFNGSYAAIAQLGIYPTNKIDLGLTYVRAYYSRGEAFVSGATGSRLANAPFGSLPTSADHFGFQSNFRITPTFNLSGWFGWSQAYAESQGLGFAGAMVNQGDQADMLNWAVSFAVLDLGKQGSVTGLMVGQPPKVTSNQGGLDDPDSAWHIQAQYRYPINDNIDLNPGFFVIINPENNSENSAIWIGTIRGIFRF